MENEIHFFTFLTLTASPRELLDVVREHDNCINLSRAATNYINLGGQEPVSSRPPKLVVQSRDKTPLDCLLLADRFSRWQF